MKLLSSLVVWLAILPAGIRAASPQAGVHGVPVEVYFSPHGGCEQAVLRELNASRTEVLVQAYSFTSRPIAEALLSAAGRGVQVRLIVDRSQEHGKQAQVQRFPGAMIDGKHAIAHNKIIIVDRATVLTGSFNFTRSAESSNAENLLIIRDRDIAERYAKNWQAHADHSEVRP